MSNLSPSAGARFRTALANEKPLQIVGTINAYMALMAERSGFAALYLSGAGVANASHGLPDLGMTSLNDVLIDATGIEKSFPGVRALAGVSLQVRAGRLVALLGELGVTSYAQIAAWDAAEIERIDAKLGRFSGRITRDQWVEQAKLLAAGDESSFVAKFGQNG